MVNYVLYYVCLCKGLKKRKQYGKIKVTKIHHIRHIGGKENG